MLILGRKPGQRLRIVTEAGEQIWVTIFGARAGQVRIGVQAPRTVAVLRDELLTEEERAAAPAINA